MAKELILDTQHSDIIRDAKFDYYGRRLATCSSSGAVKIHLYTEDQKIQLASMNTHSKAALSISWSHPIFGSLLASSGSDFKVLIYQEESLSTWTKIYVYEDHEAPVNSICWSPWEHGLILLAGSSDGCISLIYRRNEDWVPVKFSAHDYGVCSVCWSPVTSMNQAIKQFVSGGADHKVKIWTENNEGSFVHEEIEVHNRAVRSVDWRPIINTNRQIIASCSEEGAVYILVKSPESNEWRAHDALRLTVPIWKVSWNITGNVIAASCGDNITRLIRETAEENWDEFMQIDEEGKVIEK